MKDLGIKPFDSSKTRTNIKNEKGCWIFVQDIYESLFESDAIVILTEWEEYKNINWDLAEQRMRKPAWIFDSRSLIDPQDLRNNSFNFWRIGDGA